MHLNTTLRALRKPLVVGCILDIPSRTGILFSASTKVNRGEGDGGPKTARVFVMALVAL